MGVIHYAFIQRTTACNSIFCFLCTTPAPLHIKLAVGKEGISLVISSEGISLVEAQRDSP